MNARDKILSILREYNEIYQSELVKISGLSKSRVSEVLSELEKKGLIKKVKVMGRHYKIIPINNKIIKIGIIRAAEYPFIVPLYKRLLYKNYNPKIIIFDDGLELTKALALGEIDIGVSPIITQLIFSKIFDIKIITSYSKGGSGVVGLDTEIIGSTPISSMEVFTISKFHDAEIKTYKTPIRLIEALERKEVNSIAIWEPYLSLLLKKGYRLLHKFDEINCCSIAINPRKVNEDILVKEIEESFTEFKNNSERWIEDYANILNINTDLLKESIKNYKFDTDFDKNSYLLQLKRYGIYFPS
ncbi:MAG: MarR family transcriptional regulator [Sulfolobaceae archaeon]